MLRKEYEDLYLGDKSQINRDVRALDELLKSRGWHLILASIDQLIDGYRNELENVSPERLKEVQYATQNTKILKDTPQALIDYINKFDVSSDAPPKEHIGFDYKV